MTELARVEGSDHDGYRLVRASGEVDLSNVAGVTDAIARSVPGEASVVVLDLSTTTYLDSSGIAMLFRLAERLGHRRQDLRLVVPQESPVRFVLELTRVDAVIPVVGSVADLDRAGESRGFPT